MNEQPKSKKRGCFYGCLIVFIVVLVGGIVAVLGVRHWFNSAITTYTDSSPATLPQVQLPAAEVKAIQDRSDDFFKNLRNRKPTPPLVLTADEINALIESTGEKGLKGKVYVSIEGDQIKGQVSVPLDGLNVQAVKGRYLNGTVVFKLSLQNGILDVHATSVDVRGKPLPRSFMTRLTKENLAKDVMKNPDAGVVIRQINSIVVTNGAVVIEPKQTQ